MPQDNHLALDLLGTVTVWTPEIEKLCRVVATHTKFDLPGMLVYGTQRVGKSWSTRYLKSTMPVVLGYPTYCLLWKIPQTSSRSSREFYQERLMQSGVPGITHRDAAVLKKRLFDHIAGASSEQGAYRVIVIIDEAQNLQSDCYGHLIHIFNELEERRLRPFFLLVGQPELREASRQWRAMKAHQIIGRFMSVTHEFKGIQLSDLGEVLDGFDDQVPDTEPPNIRLVFEKDYADGWRLRNIAPLIADGINLIANKHNVQEKIYLPLQYLRSMTLYLLYQARDGGFSPSSLSVKHVVEAAQITNFVSLFADYVKDN